MPITLLEILSQIPDHRKDSGKRYQLKHILLFSILAMLSGATTYIDIETWIKAKYESLDKIFNLNWKRKPSKSIIQDIFSKLDIAGFEKKFRKFNFNLLQNLSQENLENQDKSQKVESDSDLNLNSPNSLKTKIIHLAIDGKTLRGSYDNLLDKKALQLLSVFETQNQIVLAHIDIEQNSKNQTENDIKNHEIPATQKIIEEIDKLTKEINLKHNIIYTIDALHTQKNPDQKQSCKSKTIKKNF